MRLKINDSDFTDSGKLRALAAMLTACADARDSLREDYVADRVPGPANEFIDFLRPRTAADKVKIQVPEHNAIHIAGSPENKQLHADMTEIGKEFTRVDAEHAAAGYDAIDTNTGEVIHVPPASQIFATDTGVDVSTRAAPETPIPPLAPTPPVAPTPAAAPTSTSAPPVAPGTSVELDVAGLPWDERIHSSNHKKNGKGEWWAKRNVSPETLDGVQDELRGLLANGRTGSADDDPIDPATLFTQGELTAASAPPVPPVAPTVDVQTRFNALVAGIMAKKLDFTQIGAGLAAIGVVPSNLPTLKTAAEKDASLLARAAAQFEIVLP